MSNLENEFSDLVFPQSQTLQEQGELAPSPQGAVMETVPIEKIDEFESLEDYAVSNPAAELPPEPSATSEAPIEGHLDSAFPTSDSFQSSSEFAIEPPSPVEERLPSLVAEGAPPFMDAPATTAPSPSPPQQSRTALDQIKMYSENSTVKATVPAAFPFSLMIHGALRPEEKEKLLTLLSEENMGFREIDLEPQLANNRILIPRISEYAGILLIQALRGTRAQIRFGPSDTIFSTEDTRSSSEEGADEVDENLSSFTSDFSHPAESIPVSSSDRISDVSPIRTTQYEVVDTLTASATLKSKTVEAENSTEYQQIIEALQRELKYKAFHKGASSIIHFKIQLTSLSSPTHYRILALGTAVKAVSQKPSSV